MTVSRVIVCEAQVPFVHGGAEVHVRELVRELRARGYTAELVSVPFKWYPKDEILPHAAAWRLLDLSESNGQPIDLVIASKFPTYFVRHPNKVAWLIHQYRAAYELCGTEYSDFQHIESDVNLRDRLIELDTEMLGECRAITLAMVAAWRWRRDDHHPNGRQAGSELLSALREGPPWPTLDAVWPDSVVGRLCPRSAGRP